MKMSCKVSWFFEWLNEKLALNGVSLYNWSGSEAKKRKGETGRAGA